MHLIPKIFIPGSIVLMMLCMVPQWVFGQEASLSGKVIDAASDEALPFANVFINNTTKGATTGLDGSFTIENIPTGAVNLVVSYVGYKTQQFSFDLEENTALTNLISLEPADKELEDIEIAEKRDKRWEKRLDQFKRIFFGDSGFAGECVLLNPWVLEFSDERGGKDSFVAMADAPLEIANNALGYHIYYHLKLFNATSSSVFFTGNIRFEEMKAESPEQQEKWIANRRYAYLGSPRHLFKAILFNNILQGQLLEEGFMIYKDKQGYENYYRRSPRFSQEEGVTVEPLVTDGLITPSYRTGLYRIELSGRIEVHYNRTSGKPKNVIYEDLPYEVSWIEIKASFIDVTKDGVEQRPDQLVVSGAMLQGRVAQMLPVDYAPADHRY